MRKAYKIILTPETEGYTVNIPDFNIGTEGKDVADALYMARDAIGIAGITLEDMGQEIPKPGTASYTLDKGETESFVDVDFMEYRRRLEKKKVKKTLTIPSWLNEQAEKAHINFSRTLEDALLDKLEIERP